MRSKSIPDQSVLHVDILRLARIKGIDKPFSFLTAHGFTDHVAKQYTTGRVPRPDLRDLLKLCRIFGCSFPDLFRLELAKGKSPAPGDPLAAADALLRVQARVLPHGDAWLLVVVFTGRDATRVFQATGDPELFAKLSNRFLGPVIGAVQHV